ncbi:MAG TPA: hypothetical protein VGB00_17345, partial [Pyrinomonadaceae bacterium]
SYLNKVLRPVSAENTLMPHGFVFSIQPNSNLKKGEVKVLPHWESRNFKVEVSVKSQAGESYSSNTAMSAKITEFLAVTDRFSRNEQDENETVVNCQFPKLFDLEIFCEGVFLKKNSDLQSEFNGRARFEQ